LAVSAGPLNAGHHAGMNYGMKAVRKVTVVLPEELLKQAEQATGLGTTATIRRGLELVAATRAYRNVRRMRGKVRFSIDLDTLREDR
jgi:hypothetical protein